MKYFNTNRVVVSTSAILLTLSLAGPGVTFAAGPASINLSSASNFAILTKSGVSTTGSTSIIGDIGVSPVTATSITGFSLILPSASPFSTSALVTGKVYAPDYASPTPVTMTTAIGDMETAYTDGAGRSNPSATELGAGNIGGLTITPGFYTWGTGVTIPSDVTLAGSANDVWIFKIAQTLTLSSNVHIVLSGGAQASNVFWIVAGQTTIGTTASFNGTILDKTAIVLNTGAILNGRALAQTAVTLDTNRVTIPTSTTPVVVPITPTSTTNPPSPATPPSIPVPASSPTPTITTSVITQTQSQPVPSDLVMRTDLQAKINALSLAITSLTSKRSGAQDSSGVSFSQQIKRVGVNLGKGSRGGDVRTLQQFLISENKGPGAQALARAGATAYFGLLTGTALAEFQVKAGIAPALGNFGVITRRYLSANY